MKKIRYSHLFLNEKFNLDNIEYTKSNHDRAFIYMNGVKQFRHIKKSQIVEIK